MSYMQYYPYCPPMPPCCPPVSCGIGAQVVVHEIEVDGTGVTGQALVGGIAPARLTLEYLVETGAANPSVKVDILSDGQTSTFNQTNISSGYYSTELSPAKPGSKLTLNSTNALARLRWCEIVCC